MVKLSTILKKNIFRSKDSNNSDDSFNKKIMTRYAIVSFGVILISCGIIIQNIFIIIETPKYRVPKNIKNDIENAVLKHSLYEDIIIIYNQKKRININVDRNTDVYDKSVDLASIFEDMILDYYINNNKIDSTYIFALKSLVKESREKHPFDKLSETQKALFYNLREDAGEYYYLIEKNLTIISEELFTKDEVIEKYLDKANFSYILSIVAITLTLYQIILQLWPKWKNMITNIKK
jgi:hypothetical protein